MSKVPEQDTTVNMNREEFVPGLVSCVTPVYNGAVWLNNLLDSLLAQTYPSVEIILSDDGSDDETLQVASSYADKFRARGYAYRILNGEHRNASAALGRGLKFVTGEFLIWPDADDVLEPESIQKRVVFLKEMEKSNDKIKAVRSLPYYFKGNSGERTAADEKRGNTEERELFHSILTSATFVCCGCYMIKSQQFFQLYPDRTIPIYDVGQNFQMLLPFMYHYECATLPEELYGVCVHENSHSRRTLTKQQEIKKYKDYEKLLDDVIEVAGIKEDRDLKLIQMWKARRRSQLARKYKMRGMQVVAYVWRMMLGDVEPWGRLCDRAKSKIKK